MTIENTTTRLWFCCRSLVVISKPFDFLSVCALVFTFVYILMHPIAIRARKRLLSSLPPSCLPIGSHSVSILQSYVVGGILVWYPTRLYIRVLAYRTYHCHYESKIPLPACFFDQIYRNSFSKCPRNCDVIMP